MPFSASRGYRNSLAHGILPLPTSSKPASLHLSDRSSTVTSLFLTKAEKFSSVQSLSRVQLFATLRTPACQASLSITNPQSLLKFMCIELVMPSNHLSLCRPLLIPPSIFPRIRVFSNESVLPIRWPNYWSKLFLSHKMQTKHAVRFFCNFCECVKNNNI